MDELLTKYGAKGPSGRATPRGVDALLSRYGVPSGKIRSPQGTGGPLALLGRYTPPRREISMGQYRPLTAEEGERNREFAQEQINKAFRDSDTPAEAYEKAKLYADYLKRTAGRGEIGRPESGILHFLGRHLVQPALRTLTETGEAAGRAGAGAVAAGANLAMKAGTKALTGKAEGVPWTGAWKPSTDVELARNIVLWSPPGIMAGTLKGTMESLAAGEYGQALMNALIGAGVGGHMVRGALSPSAAEGLPRTSWQELPRATEVVRPVKILGEKAAPEPGRSGVPPPSPERPAPTLEPAGEWWDTMNLSERNDAWHRAYPGRAPGFGGLDPKRYNKPFAKLTKGAQADVQHVYERVASAPAETKPANRIRVAEVKRIAAEHPGPYQIDTSRDGRAWRVFDSTGAEVRRAREGGLHEVYDFTEQDQAQRFADELNRRAPAPEPTPAPAVAPTPEAARPPAAPEAPLPGTAEEAATPTPPPEAPVEAPSAPKKPPVAAGPVVGAGGSPRTEAARTLGISKADLVRNLKQPAESAAVVKGLREAGWSDARIEPVLRTSRVPRIEKLNALEEDVRQRIKGKLQQLGATPDPTIVADWVELGAIKMAKGAIRFADWSAEMVTDIGEAIRPHLRRVYAAALKHRKQNIEPAVDPVAKLTKLIGGAETRNVEIAGEVHKLRQRQTAKVAGAHAKYTGKEAAIRGSAARAGGVAPELRAQFKDVESKLSPQEVDELFDRIRTTRAIAHPLERQSAMDSLGKLMSGIVPGRAELVLLEKVFGPDLIRAVLRKRGFLPNLQDLVVDVMGFHRNILTTADVSALFRQALWAAGEREYWGTMKEIPGLLRSERGYAQVMDRITSDPDYQILKKAGLGITERGEAASQAMREEAFSSRLMQRLDKLGPVIAGPRAVMGASERSYVGYLNALRFSLAKKYLAVLKLEYPKGKVPLDRVRAISHAINVLTGRGKLGSMEKAAGELGTVIFAPRFIAARLQLPFLLVSRDPLVRKMALKNISRVAGAGAAFLALVGGTGIGEVGLDPLSADFGKVRVRDWRLDIWGGLTPWIRALAQVVMGKRRTLHGRTVARSRTEILERFAESKLAPTPGLLLALARGHTWVGQEIYENPAQLRQFLAEQFTPMGVRDIIEAWQQEGPIMGAITIAPAMTGMGVQTYQETPIQKYWAGVDPMVPKNLMPLWSEYKALQPRDRAEFLRLHPEIADLPQWEDVIRTGIRMEYPEVEKGLVERAGYAPMTPVGTQHLEKLKKEGRVPARR